MVSQLESHITAWQANLASFRSIIHHVRITNILFDRELAMYRGVSACEIGTVWAWRSKQVKNYRGRTCSEALTDARNISVEARAVTIFVQAVIVAGVAKQEWENCSYAACESAMCQRVICGVVGICRLCIGRRKHEGYVCCYIQTITYVHYELSLKAESARGCGKRVQNLENRYVATIPVASSRL